MDQFDDQYYLPPANFPRLLSTDRPPSHRGSVSQYDEQGASQAGSVHSRASRTSRASKASIRSASTWNRKDWKPPIQREVRYPFADESKPLPAAILDDGPSWSEAKLRFSPTLRRPESGRGDWGSVLQGDTPIYTSRPKPQPPPSSNNTQQADVDTRSVCLRDQSRTRIRGFSRASALCINNLHLPPRLPRFEPATNPPGTLPGFKPQGKGQVKARVTLTLTLTQP